MDWQFAITLCAITLASAYFVWRAYRAWQNSKAGGCGGSCGCAKSSEAATEQKTPVLIPAEQLTMRLKRKV